MVTHTIVTMAEGTNQELRDALHDNADFEETSSVTKARAYITAAVRFLSLEPVNQSDQGSSLQYAAQQINDQLKRARAFVAANDASSSPTSRVRFFSTDEFRR